MSFVKYIFFVTIFIGINLPSFAQTRDIKIKTLQKELSTSLSDKRKVEIYNEIAKLHLKIDIRITDSLAQVALNIAQKIGDKNGEGVALLRKAQVKHEIPDILKSLSLAKKAEKCGSLKIFVELGFPCKNPSSKVLKISHIESKSFDGSQKVVRTFNDTI